MVKNFFFTTFLSLFFVSFLEASNEKINQQIYELKTSQDYAQKINDEKITLIMGQIIQKENEIKELEKKIDELRKDKNSLSNYKDIIDRQDKRIEDLNHYFFWYGILITILLFGVSYISYRFTSNESKDIVNEWLEKNKKTVLEPVEKITSEAKASIKKELLDMYQEQEKSFDLTHKLNEKEKSIINKVNELLLEKEKAEYTYDDWHSKFLNAYHKDDFKKALYFITKAEKHASNEYEKLYVIFNQAFLNGKINTKSSLNKSIELYLKIVNRKNDISNSRVREILLRSISNLSIMYQKIEQRIEEVKYIDYFIDIYDKEKDGHLNNLLVQLVLNKIEYLLVNKEDFEKESKIIIENSNSNENLACHEMLVILKNSVEKTQDKEIDKWKSTFSDINLKDWHFNFITDWANSFEEEVIKERLLRYIDIFEKHNKSVEEN